VDFQRRQDDHRRRLTSLMLAHLSIRDIVLIEKLEIDFARGLTVLTGETGAGKSILLDALSLALGARGDAGLVRHGASQGHITAVFDLASGHPARAVLSENAIEDDGDIILRRVQSADGKSRVFVNDQPASVALLRALGAALVEIHGQHDDRALVSPEAHRALLDAFGGLGGELGQVRTSYRDWRAAGSALAKHKARVEAAAREADYLRASSDELRALNPQEGEEEELAEARAKMMRAEKVAADLSEANDILSGTGSAMPSLASLLRRLERKQAEAQELVQPIVEALEQTVLALSDAQGAAEQALRMSEYDPKLLERSEERLFALRAAARKFSVSVDKLPALAERMAQDLADLDAGEAGLKKLAAEAGAAKKAYEQAASNLSAKRLKFARALEKSVMAELPALKLERADFIVEIATDADAHGPDGIDFVEFWVRTNPGTKAGPMMKTASGGELSRFLLALKVALADKGSAPTLVFDEIDTGVGGAVADAIGQRLKRLAGKVQVLSVTHAPQVAARADQHLLIAKSENGGRMATSVAHMDSGERQEEIARMLAGASITVEARAAAERLLRENAPYSS
jgi:DNA repair protein RecN (Recombination protein N)